ncbi:hypothetical protein [Fusobacterium ulcerans]|jgi:hypothetical protein|uniref:phage tail fiber protein n=1 Tax=Fusobacterium ulcerans TaxID=861 RepID=UPI00206A5481|nr:hypothetical protein [Fusobacterium ulcerans]DAV87480.1 MAG TPA: hypothetical protein [Caudoviricetes sp.]
MAGLTHEGENFIINEIFRKDGTKYYLGLLKSNPTDNATTIDEVKTASYARQQIIFEVPNLGETYNKNKITFPVATENWGWITHIGLFDAETAGRLIAYSALDYTKEIRAADIYEIPDAYFIFKVD